MNNYVKYATIILAQQNIITNGRTIKRQVLVLKGGKVQMNNNKSNSVTPVNRGFKSGVAPFWARGTYGTFGRTGYDLCLDAKTYKRSGMSREDYLRYCDEYEVPPHISAAVADEVFGRA